MIYVQLRDNIKGLKYEHKQNLIISSLQSTVIMFVHKTFTVITNLFGLNFFEQKISLSFVLFLNMVVLNIHGIINVYYAMVATNPKLKIVYIIIDFVQLGWPLIYKNLIFFWSIYMKNIDQKFDDKVRKVFKPSNIRKNQKKFFIYVIVTILILMMKVAFQHGGVNYIYNFSNFFSTLINATCDFVFVYHISCLNDHVRFINQNYAKCDIVEKTLNIIEIKRLIHLRYSQTLAFAISHDFFLITVSLYWIFVRILFDHLKNLEGNP